MQIPLYVTLLGGAAAGASLTALVSLFTGWLSRRHDQRRWLLDKRLEAYSAFNELASQWRTLSPPDAPSIEHLQKLYVDLEAQSVRIELLAPRGTADAASVVLSTAVLLWRELDNAGRRDVDRADWKQASNSMNDATTVLESLMRADVQGRSRRRTVPRR